MRDKRSKYERDVADGIRSAYGDAVFNTEIRRRVKLKEMSAIGIDLADPSMEDYFSLVGEIIERTTNAKEKQYNE
jgi:cellulose biosynthesis protein BcsQ